jgi:HEAT repeat protein
MRFVVWILLLLGVSTMSVYGTDYRAHSANSPQLSAEDSAQIDAFIKRLKTEKYDNLYSGATWMLIHDYKDQNQIDAVLKAFQNYLEAFAKYEKGDVAAVKELGGFKSFTAQLAKWLDSPEQCVRAFAATMLGVSGDTAYVARIADLLKSTESKDELLVYDKYAAAVALGVMGAREYTDTLVALLSSKNEYDRAGGARGLGWMQAKDRAPAIAKLLNDEDEHVRDAAKETLKMLGVKSQ